MQELIRQSIRSGTIASLAMLPFGMLFKAAGLRVGHYGPRFAGLFFAEPGPVLLFAQHLVIGWLSALPLLALLPAGGRKPRAIAIGAAYGAGYYVLVNSLALPWGFGDPTPWELGAAVVLPSLVVHLVFGLAVAASART